MPQKKGVPLIVDTFDKQYLVDKKTGCYVWQRGRKGKEAKRGGGYGCFRLDGKTIGAHRYAWERKHGKVAIGLQVMHKCHNTLCVNPKHLMLGTNEQNMIQRAAALRYRAKLNPEKVRYIRRTYEAGEMFQTELAVELQVSDSVISEVINRKAWKHVR